MEIFKSNQIWSSGVADILTLEGVLFGYDVLTAMLFVSSFT